jgi:hypothetical protein
MMNENLKSYSQKVFGKTQADWSALGNHFDMLVSKRDGKDFATFQGEDPDKSKFGMWDNEAVTAGASMFSSHKMKVTNHQHPDHEKALKLHVEKFGNDDELALSHFIGYARKTMGAEKRHIPNQAYQNSLFKNLNFPTPEDQAFGNKLKNLLEKKWAAFGYDGDSDFIDSFIKDHPFSKDPRNLNFKTA